MSLAPPPPIPGMGQSNRSPSWQAPPLCSKMQYMTNLRKLSPPEWCYTDPARRIDRPARVPPPRARPADDPAKKTCLTEYERASLVMISVCKGNDKECKPECKKMVRSRCRDPNQYSLSPAHRGFSARRACWFRARALL